MITGARWALGGAQQFFGVTPDLATFGKAFANGYPLAFVAGRADLMQHAWPISGTFGGELTGARRLPGGPRASTA
jgi:glutamate-1-semialdehyde 2,1-aminomutase